VPGVAAVRQERAAPDREEPLYGEVCPYATVELLKNSEESGGNFVAHQHQVSALLEYMQGHDLGWRDIFVTVSTLNCSLPVLFVWKQGFYF
jgi:hypothetical protein